MKLGEIQRALVVDLSDQFEASGIEYTCGAVIIDFVKDKITEQHMIETRLSSGRIARRVWDEIHRRQYGK